MEDLGLLFDPSLSDEPWTDETPSTKCPKKDKSGKGQRGMTARSLTFADLKSAPIEKDSAKSSVGSLKTNGYFFGTVRTRLHSSYRLADH